MAAQRLIEIDDARRTILDAVTPLAAERVKLDKCLGRVLAEDVVAAAPVPPFDNSAMDGYAVRHDDLAPASARHPVTLRLVDESRAGMPAAVGLGAGEAVSISTGAALPAGADAVVALEDAASDDGRVEIRSPAPVHQHVRMAGEDIRSGQAVLARGSRLGASELGVLGSLGRGEARCALRPRLSVLVTGDELLDAGEPARPGAVHDANSHSIPALARLAGAHVTAVARCLDEPGATRAAIAHALQNVDVAVICGGVSVGRHDHVRQSLAELDVCERFWGVALKPGRPSWFGARERTLVFGLPGNPVSAMVTFVLFVAPALAALTGPAGGAGALATLDSDYEKLAGRAHAVRCHVEARADGLYATPTGPQGSHILTSMLAADALAIIPSARESVRRGERVRLLALPGGEMPSGAAAVSPGSEAAAWTTT